MTIEKVSILTDVKQYTLKEVVPGTYFKFKDNKTIFIKCNEDGPHSQYVAVFNLDQKKVERYDGSLILGQVFTSVEINLKEVRK